MAPYLFGHLVGGADNPHPDRLPLTYGYVIGAVVMILGGLVAWFFAVNAEGQSLESIADPLSKADASNTPIAEADTGSAQSNDTDEIAHGAEPSIRSS